MTFVLAFLAAVLAMLAGAVAALSTHVLVDLARRGPQAAQEAFERGDHLGKFFRSDRHPTLGDCMSKDA